MPDTLLVIAFWIISTALWFLKSGSVIFGILALAGWSSAGVYVINCGKAGNGIALIVIWCVFLIISIYSFTSEGGNHE